MTTYPGISFPDIDPVLFQWGWVIIRWYSLAYIFGLLGAWGLARKMSKMSNSPFTTLKIDDFLIWADPKSTRLNSSHRLLSRMPSSA